MSSIAVGGTEPEPEPKRRRLLDPGGPIEDDETARQKMRDAEVYERGVDGAWGEYDGFDPDNVADVKSRYPCDENEDDDNSITPMGHFAKKGDLLMMRWLYVNGADTRDVNVAIHFPMYLAAVGGNNEACKWLYEHGAAKDVNRRTSSGNPNGPSALIIAFGKGSPKQHLSRWYILNGALCKGDDSGELDVEMIKQDLGVYSCLVQEREMFLKWANDLHQARTSFHLFLSGALSAPQHAYRTRRSSPLKILSGKAGVLELISDYTGIVRGREAKIIRQLTEMLPNYFRNI